MGKASTTLMVSVLAVLVFTSPAKAQNVTWTLQDVTFSNGITANGTIVVNPIANNGYYDVVSWDVTFGGTLAGYSTTSFGTLPPGGAFDGDDSAQTSYYETSPVQDALVIGAGTKPPLSNQGLSITMELMANDLFPPGSGPTTIPLLVSTPALQESNISEYNYSTEQYTSVGNLLTGSIIQSVPEPAPLELIGFGSIIFLLGRVLRLVSGTSFLPKKHYFPGERVL
jgi:hypothetical protein